MAVMQKRTKIICANEGDIKERYRENNGSLEERHRQVCSKRTRIRKLAKRKKVNEDNARKQQGEVEEETKKQYRRGLLKRRAAREADVSTEKKITGGIKRSRGNCERVRGGQGGGGAPYSAISGPLR